ncbi:MAG: hypothetical protein AABZ13_05150, partial [Planctomycetota bacterium]
MNNNIAGKIVVITGASSGLKVFSPIGSVYSATKFAVRAISEGLRVETGPYLR